MQAALVQSSLNELLEHLERQLAIEDRRSTPRYRILGPLSIAAVFGGPTPRLYQGWAQDLSRQGIGWLMTEPLTVNARITLDLTAIAGRALVLPATVTRCQQPLSGIYQVGGMFLIEEAMAHPIAG